MSAMVILTPLLFFNLLRYLIISWMRGGGKNNGCSDLRGFEAASVAVGFVKDPVEPHTRAAIRRN